MIAVTRIYLVRHADGAVIKEYLVDASSQATAERFISKRYVSAAVAKSKEVAQMVGAGTKVLAAGSGGGGTDSASS